MELREKIAEIIAPMLSEPGWEASMNQARGLAGGILAIPELTRSTADPGMEACDHYKMVSGGNGPWTCVKCGAVDPPRPKYGTITCPTADLGEELVGRLRAYRGGTTEWRDLMDEAADRLILYREALELIAEGKGGKADCIRRFAKAALSRSGG